MQKKFNKEVIASFETNTNFIGYAECYLCKDGEYINVYILDEVFKQDEPNCLEQQIPIENFEDIYKTDAWMHSQIIQKDLWYKYGHFNENKFPYSFNISCYNSEEDKEIF